ncbi:kinesin heavy chain [Drosophila novamexicana]|uniref:kinesin heavy chain n=1 Tax=Drosophila novamexicana TaxID=47314 RepID=UPI0011E5C0B5|nr:kinesin heavy chain [Drosophila novamexicana]
MAKMYLFRKLSELSQHQSDVCEEAIASVLDDVLKGKTSTIFNYGNWPDYGTAIEDDRAIKLDMIDRILNNLFSHVYTMEVTMEINISIKHMQHYVVQDRLVHNIGSDDNDCLTEAREHFVASSHDVYMYIEKVIGQLQQQQQQSDHKMTANDYPYALFTICVRQTNLEQSMHLHGSLQLVHLMCVQQPEMLLQLATPMASLLRIISALAGNPKTHLRYYNIRLTRILKDLLGEDETTIIINYTTVPDIQLDTVSAIGCAKIWKALYMRERNKCHCLSEKMFSLKCWSGSGRKFQLFELLELLKISCSSSQLELGFTGSNQRSAFTKSDPTSIQFYDKFLQEQEQLLISCDNVLCEEQRQLCAQLKHIKADAAASFGEMLEIQHILAQLTLNFEQNNQQLEQKNQMLTRLNLLLAEANKKVQKQRLVFQRKLAMYSEMFKSLWSEQRLALQLQEQEREAQLSKMFDTIFHELHSTHQMNQLESSELQRHCAKSGR